MGRRITIRGTKLRRFLEKNLRRPSNRFLSVFRAFLMGVLEKRVFCGGVFVVISWWLLVICGEKEGSFPALKNTPHFANLFFGVRMLVAIRVLVWAAGWRRTLRLAPPRGYSSGLNKKVHFICARERLLKLPIRKAL
jgi:hypothetical protein